MSIIIYSAVIPVLAVIFYYAAVRKIVVRENHVVVLYRNGKFYRLLEPGMHRVICLFTVLTSREFDTRTSIVVVPGQELLTSDNVGIKVSMTISYRIADAALLDRSVENYNGFVYTSVQIALRIAIGLRTVEDLLEKRNEIGKDIFERVSKELVPIGIEAEMTEVKDVMFPADLKRIFNEVIRAKKEGQAVLEKARGESAALRNLANTAKMLEKNPELMNLRILQTLSDASSVPGNTFVMGMAQGMFAPCAGLPGK
ncbi:MAG TPA: slipin family protein [bacterium]|nr:slipin family protein [bacterium]